MTLLERLCKVNHFLTVLKKRDYGCKVNEKDNIAGKGMLNRILVERLQKKRNSPSNAQENAVG
jgi:hypothetical protein